MDFVALRVFKTVVEEGGIKPAAEKLHRVQSNITTRIQRLEASLGTQLFFREKRRLILSPTGKLFLEYVDKILQLSEQARDSVVGSAPRGTLRLGTLESTAASRLPPLLSRYHANYPAVRVELRTGTSEALVNAVLRHELEAAFVADPAESAWLEIMPVFSEELVVVSPKPHARIHRGRDVRTDTVIAFPAGCAYRRRLQAWLGEDGVVPQKTLELSSYHAIVACVASGTGIAFAPRSVLETVRGSDEVAVHRLPRRVGRVVTALIWRKEDPSSALGALRADVDPVKEGDNWTAAERRARKRVWLPE